MIFTLQCLILVKIMPRVLFCRKYSLGRANKHKIAKDEVNYKIATKGRVEVQLGLSITKDPRALIRFLEIIN